MSYLSNPFCFFLLLKANLICFAWNVLLNLFEKNQQNKQNECNNGGATAKLSTINKLNLDDEQDLIEYLLKNSIDSFHNYVAYILTPNNSSKTNKNSNSKAANGDFQVTETKKSMQVREIVWCLNKILKKKRFFHVF